VARLLNREISRIDERLSRQVNAILHHPRFQKLEASWRGLKYLIEQATDVDNMQIRVISLTWKELARDLDLAIEFDQSALFKKVYEEEYGVAGGTPYSVLLGDYEVRHQPSAAHPVDDVTALMRVSQVAACAFAPFVAAAHPAVYGMDSFEQFERRPNLPRTFDGLEYKTWRTMRHMADARYVGLVMPHVLMRLPYRDDGSRRDAFIFNEDVTGPDRSKYLWGNAVYAFGSVLVRAFAQSRWFADIRGVQRGQEEGGLVVGLPAQSFGTDAPHVAVKCSVDVMITDDQEKELSELGFIPLCHAKDTEFSVFYSNQSLQRPEKMSDIWATTNARMSAMMQYMLCASRFAHYVKVIARDKIGTFVDAKAFQSFLHSWLQQYVAPGSGTSPEQKARFPLRSAKVAVREHPGKPGFYLTEIHLWPHFQLDELTATLKLVTEFAPAK
jgi:type VI secretion system ImpC/EvpB family protein